MGRAAGQGAVAVAAARQHRRQSAGARCTSCRQVAAPRSTCPVYLDLPTTIHKLSAILLTTIHLPFHHPPPPPHTHTPEQVEGRKRYEFLEAVVSGMDAHVRFYERGYQCLHGLEPYIQHALEVGAAGFAVQAGRAGRGWGDLLAIHMHPIIPITLSSLPHSLHASRAPGGGGA